MEQAVDIVSKVIILDDSREHSKQLKNFCDQNRLVGLKVSRDSQDILSILKTKVDLAAILMSEDYCDSLFDTVSLAIQIHSSRPELPIVLRLKSDSEYAELTPDLRRVFCATYSMDDMSPLTKVVDEYIFSLYYPNALVRGISEIGVSTLASQFREHKVTLDTPYLVRDRIIFGEVFSLIPLESNWCRGYMMIQAEENSVFDGFVRQDKGGAAPVKSFRTVNNILGELTNLIWGAFKNRFIGSDKIELRTSIQIPIVANHLHNYISFGSENPQLCFRYTLLDQASGEKFNILQWFIFNLEWTPENFSEQQASVDELVDAGELEFF